MLDRCRGDASPMGGALEVADASGWQVIPSRYGAAMPSGTIEHDLLDGVLLVLHGAMVIASYPDGEGEVLRRVRGHLRECLGEAGKLVPIAADLDHANTSDAMAANRC